MRESYRTFRSADLVVGIIGSAVLGGLLVADVVGGVRLNTAPLYPTVLLFCLLRRNRLLSLLLTVVALVVTFAAYPLEQGDTRSLVHRTMAAAAIIATAFAIDAFLRSRRLIDSSEAALLERARELEATNAELVAREEEIARQNEELQNQTEELERQSEELRVGNDELARRERMLESLLTLSRTLTSSSRRDDTMEKICHTLGALVNGPHSAAAIIQREGDEVHVVCQQGFGEGGVGSDRWPLRSSFTQLVLERGRTGYLEDVELRPELILPQPRNGPKLRSVIAAPLRVGGKLFGTLEAFHTERHAWTNEQITLIESLAAQTSISLEAADLFQRIEEERKRLKIVLDTVPFGVAIMDGSDKRILVNPAGAAMLNVPLDSDISNAMVASRLKLFRGGKPLPLDQRPIVRAYQTGEVITNEEIELVFNTGRRIHTLGSAAPIRDRNDQIVGAVVGWADITEHRTLQNELDARRREAEEAKLRKSRFLAAVSHDIRTPANAISLLAELMQRTATTPSLIQEIPEIAVDLKRSAMTLVDLVSDVLDLTRFDSGKVDLQETIVSLGDVVTEECSQLQQSAREKGLEFKCEPPQPPIQIRTDRVKLSRILTNLISNSIKFTEIGTIRVGTRQASDDGNAVTIFISDTGCGIPREHFDRIFDEYFQLKNPERDRAKGSGLGLAICRRLIDAMGGSISVQSEVGKGTTFEVTLPGSSVVSS